MDHPYRYFVAGGASLSAIETFVAEQAGYNPEAAQGEMEKLKESYDIVGFGSVWDEADNKNRELYTFKDQKNPGLGWISEDDVMPGYYSPDMNTQEGRNFQVVYEVIHGRRDAQSRFAQWLSADNIDTCPGMFFNHYKDAEFSRLSAGFEKLGSDYIIRVPVVNYEDGVDWMTPPDSKPLSVSGYFKLNETQGNLPLNPTSKNHVQHTSKYELGPDFTLQ